MKYIKKVILENFQSHKYTEIELDQYLNVIVGPSDHGKTAIIRGIKWALFNEPVGDFFIREGETECSVTIIFNDNIKLKRYRSKTKNAYYIYDNNGEETVFEGFGTKVPQEIIDKTSMRKIILDSGQSNSINIGEQLEGPFLLSEKNSTRANAIGRLVGVHIVDNALKDTLKDIRNLNTKRKNYKETLEDLHENLSEYDYLDDLTIKVNKLKNIKDKIHNKQSKLDNLTQKLKLFQKTSEEYNILKKYLRKLKNLEKVSNKEKILSRKIKKFSYIYDKYYMLIKIQNNIKEDNNLLILLKDIHKIEKTINKLSILFNMTSKLETIYNKYKYTEDTLSIYNNILKALQKNVLIEKRISLIEENLQRLKKIQNLKEKLDEIHKNISIGQIYINKLSNVNLIFNKKDLLESKYKILQNLVNYKKEYDANKTRIFKIENNLSNINKEMNKYLNRYKIILNKVEVCPLCFSPIDKARTKKIIDSYKKEEIHQ